MANIDGLWMCCRAECFNKLRFNDTLYDDSHCHDANLSMQVLANGWDVMVNTEILIEHFAKSIITLDYFRAADRWYSRWNSLLPVARGITLEPRIVEIMNYYTLDAIRYEKTLIENQRLLSTHAYRLGRNILKPLNALLHK